MPHDTPLISTIVVGLLLALVFGAIAHRLKLSPLAGYLLAGIAVGPFTPGFVANQELANELAEIGVILLMFGVGLHFSPKDLLAVKAIAIPGAFAQILVATLFGLGLGWLLGWGVGAGLVFGLCLSVASTVVLLRALQERRLLDTERGKVAIGWLIVEDLAMVLALVLLPALAEGLKGPDAGLSFQGLLPILGVTLGKIAAFLLVVYFGGRRVIPYLLHEVAHTGSRELFRLAVLVIALGVAFGSAKLFGVSFALGAFFAGMILSGSELSQRATQEVLPFRDAFAVLFFISVGMLFDPSIIVRQPGPVLATLAIIVIGKSIAAFLIVRLFGHPLRTALTISASLAQIGEFSFILVGLGVALGLVPTAGRDLVLAGAILSILLNPLLFVALDRYLARIDAASAAATSPAEAATPAAGPPEPARVPVLDTNLTGHVVLAGYGRVGTMLAEAARRRDLPLLVIEADEARVDQARADGFESILGNAADPEIADAANFPGARCLVVAIPDAFEGGQVVEQARRVNPDLPIYARSGSDAEKAHLKSFGATTVVQAQTEVAGALIDLLPASTTAPVSSSSE